MIYSIIIKKSRKKNSIDSTRINQNTMFRVESREKKKFFFFNVSNRISRKKEEFNPEDQKEKKNVNIFFFEK